MIVVLSAGCFPLQPPFRRSKRPADRARLGVWRGLLGVAAAAGDIQPFLAEVSQ